MNGLDDNRIRQKGQDPNRLFGDWFEMDKSKKVKL